MDNRDSRVGGLPKLGPLKKSLSCVGASDISDGTMSEMQKKFLHFVITDEMMADDLSSRIYHHLG